MLSVSAGDERKLDPSNRTDNRPVSPGTHEPFADGSPSENEGSDPIFTTAVAMLRSIPINLVDAGVVLCRAAQLYRDDPVTIAAIDLTRRHVSELIGGDHIGD